VRYGEGMWNRQPSQNGESSQPVNTTRSEMQARAVSRVCRPAPAGAGSGGGAATHAAGMVVAVVPCGRQNVGGGKAAYG